MSQPSDAHESLRFASDAVRGWVTEEPNSADYLDDHVLMASLRTVQTLMFERDDLNKSSVECKVEKMSVEMAMSYFQAEVRCWVVQAKATRLQEAATDEDCERETPARKVVESASGVEEVVADTHGRSKVDCCCV